MIIEKTIKFEVAKEDLEGKYTWHEADKECPKGWRLPTIRELEVMYENKDSLNISKKWYWSSTEGVFNNARLLSFSIGDKNWLYKDNYNRVRYVRSVE